VLLPRRTFHRIIDTVCCTTGRRTASPRQWDGYRTCRRTIVPFDTTLSARGRGAPRGPARRKPPPSRRSPATRVQTGTDRRRARLSRHTTHMAMASPRSAPVAWKQRVTVEGRIKLSRWVRLPASRWRRRCSTTRSACGCCSSDVPASPGIVPGTVIRATGTVGEYKGHLALANPRYETARRAGARWSYFSLTWSAGEPRS